MPSAARRFGPCNAEFRSYRREKTGVKPPAGFGLLGFQSLGPQPLAKNAVLGTAEEIFVLDNAFALIEGRPALVYTKTGPACALRGCDASTCRYAHFPAWSVRAFAAASMQSAQRTNSRIP